MPPFFGGIRNLGRGLLNSIRNGTSPGNVALLSNQPTDILGLNVTFTYRGRAVVSRAALASRHSVANAAMQLRLVDAASGKAVFSETFSAAAVANGTVMARMDSGPVTALADGTPLVAGTTYTWKLMIQGPAGTWQMPVAGNTEFVAHHEVLEV